MSLFEAGLQQQLSSCHCSFVKARSLVLDYRLQARLHLLFGGIGRQQERFFLIFLLFFFSLGRGGLSWGVGCVWCVSACICALVAVVSPRQPQPNFLFRELRSGPVRDRATQAGASCFLGVAEGMQGFRQEERRGAAVAMLPFRAWRRSLRRADLQDVSSSGADAKQKTQKQHIFLFFVFLCFLCFVCFFVFFGVFCFAFVFFVFFCVFCFLFFLFFVFFQAFEARVVELLVAHFDVPAPARGARRHRRHHLSTLLVRRPRPAPPT